MKFELIQENDNNNYSIINDVIKDKIQKKRISCCKLKTNLNKDKIIIIILLCIIFLLFIYLIILFCKLVNNNKKIHSLIDLHLNSSELIDENITNKTNISLIINNNTNIIYNSNKTINKSFEYIGISSIKGEINKTTKNNLFNNSIEELIFDNITISYKKAQDFLNKGINGILVKKNNYVIPENPIISAVIPVYNSRNLILRAIRSIQNQDMDNIEIVLVNDFSTDGTLSYIEELQKEDLRIKIIKNKKNMGTLYSRSIGALSAKGKYIFPLDNDDMFLNYDVFNTIYNIAIKDNFDIVEYKGIKIWGIYNLLNKQLGDTYFSSHKKNLILYQPELGNYPLKFSNDSKQIYIWDNYLWNKCIKTEIYQKALNIFGEERYKRRMIFHEDLIMVIILFNTAESFRFIEKYGMLNIGRPGSASSLSKDLNLLEMYLIDAAIDFSKKTFENKKTIAQFVTFLLNKNNLNKTLENNENKKLLNSILKRTYSCEYISEEDKNNIRNISLNILKINDDNNTK